MGIRSLVILNKSIKMNTRSKTRASKQCIVCHTDNPVKVDSAENSIQKAYCYGKLEVSLFFFITFGASLKKNRK